MAQLVEQVYSTALFSLAKEEGDLLNIEKDFRRFVEILEDNQDFFEFFKSPVIEKDGKKRVLSHIFEKDMNKTLYNFLNVTIDKNRMNRVMETAKNFFKLCDEENRMEDTHVESAVTLSEEELEKIKEVLKKVSGKNIRLTQSVNPALLGGLKIRMGNRIIDSSLQTELEDLKAKIYRTIV